MTDKERFSAACGKACGELLGKRDSSIGVLSEKALHLALKYYIDEDSAHHEIKVGKNFADIKNGDGIFEIQTACFIRLRKKLERFLADEKVTVIHPIAYKKRICNIGCDGCVSNFRKSPKTGSFAEALPELWAIRDYLDDPNLRVLLLLTDMDEYRVEEGKNRFGKARLTRAERIPTALFDSLFINCKNDLKYLVPKDIPEVFTVKDFAKATKMRGRKAGLAVKCLFVCGVLEKCENRGKAFTYRLAKAKKETDTSKVKT